MDQICPTIPLGWRATGRFVVKARADGSEYQEEVIEEIPQGEIAATLKAQVADAVQRHLDDAVVLRNYSSAAAAVSYVGDPNARWDAEGRAVRAWRSAVWTTCFAILDDVLAGKRDPLTPKQVILELPPLVWPE